MAKQPRRFTIKVAQGKDVLEPFSKKETKYLALPPRKLPAPTIKIFFINSIIFQNKHYKNTTFFFFVIFAPMKKIILTLLIFSIVLGVKAQKTPLMGWSSWNAYGLNINDSLICSQADAIIGLGLAEKGYRYINIDDGYFGGRDANGKLLTHKERFPNGLRGLVDYLHNKGLKAGIYTDAGANTCGSYWATPKDTMGIGVGLYGHDKQDFELFFNEWDFDFVKIDYCGAEARNNIDRLDLDEKTRYKEIAQALKTTSKKEISWNICRWAFPGTWACEIADSWRTTEDIYLGWQSIKSIISQSLYLSAYTSFGHYNDMDMLEVGRGMSEEEDKTHFGIWCIMSSPLMLGCDLNSLSENALSLLKNEELIALNQDTLGLQAYVVEKTNDCYILVKDIEKRNDKTRAVAAYNPTDNTQTININFKTLDLLGKIKIRDLFQRKDLGIWQNQCFEITLPPHSTRIYRLEAEERNERTKYEAETAWLSAYQELEENLTPPIAIYEENPQASGEMIVSNLGHNPNNDLQWREVYSKNGGKYIMQLNYISQKESQLKIGINQETPIEIKIKSNPNSTIEQKDIEIHLQKGNNTIRLYTDQSPMPDIDYMELKKR